MALQTEFEKRIAKDSEAIVFEEEARKFFLASHQVGTRRDEHAKVCSLYWPLLSESQYWVAVANGSQFYAKANPNLPRFRSCNGIPSRIGPKYLPMQPKLITISVNIPWNATNTARIPRKCNLILCKIRPNSTHIQPKCVPNSVNIPSTCNPNRPNFMPTSVVKRHTKKGRVWR